MAVAFNVSDTRQTVAGNTVSFAYSCSAGSNRLLLSQTRSSAVSVSSGTYAGAALTNVGSVGGIIMWRKIAPATGSNTLAFTLSSYGRTHASTSDWTGVDQTTPLGTAVTATGTSVTPATASVTCPTDGAIFGGEYSAYTTAGAPTAGAGTTLEGAEREGAGGTTKAGGRRSTTGTISFSIASSAAWEAQAFPIYPVASPRLGDMNFMGI